MGKVAGIDIFEELEKSKHNKITPKEAKFYRDKHVIETWGINNARDSKDILGIDEANLDILEGKGKIPNEIKDKLKEASKVFSPKIQQAERFYEIMPVYYDDGGLWWIWNNGVRCWQIVDEVTLANYLYLSAGYDTINAKERNEMVQALKQVGRMYRPMPMKRTWIQFKDKIVDFQTSEEFEATSDYFAVNPVPWKLGKSPETPTMDKIFTEWVGIELKEVLYQILAYTLIPDYPIHRIFCFIGAGMNGKSKFLDLLRKFVGEHNCCSTELDNLISSRFEVARLYKKLVCLMGETNFSELSRTSMLKKLSGGDLIGFEHKGKNPFEDKNYAKIIISTNNLPATTDKTIGFYRRWMITDFPNTFSEKKDILSDIPDWEYENLATKSISYLKSLITRREFYNEGTIEERMQKYEAKSNFIEQFLKEFTRESCNAYITKADFYKKFIAWCRENNHRDMSETSVGIALKRIGIAESRKHFDWLFDGRGGMARIWEGIEWI